MATQIFRIYPFKKNKKEHDESSWWTVMVFDSVKEMRSWTAKTCVRCPGKRPYLIGKDHRGLTHCHGGKEKVDTYGQVACDGLVGEIGVIFLQQKDNGVGVVSHECCHAMLYTVGNYTHVINMASPVFSETDEQMAQILGNLVNQIYVRGI